MLNPICTCTCTPVITVPTFSHQCYIIINYTPCEQTTSLWSCMTQLFSFFPKLNINSSVPALQTWVNIFWMTYPSTKYSHLMTMKGMHTWPAPGINADHLLPSRNLRYALNDRSLSIFCNWNTLELHALDLPQNVVWIFKSAERKATKIFYH